MQFSELMGQEVGVLIPRIDKVKIFHVKILGVEGGGIWISSQAATESSCKYSKSKPRQKSSYSSSPITK